MTEQQVRAEIARAEQLHRELARAGEPTTAVECELAWLQCELRAVLAGQVSVDFEERFGF
jgi:hypothetical protein